MSTLIAALLSILAFAGTTISGKIHDRQTTRDRLITDAEKQCFEGDVANRNCTLLNELTKSTIIKTVKVKTPLGSRIEILPESTEAK